jgi:hypothetical protein
MAEPQVAKPQEAKMLPTLGLTGMTQSDGADRAGSLRMDYVCSTAGLLLLLGNVGGGGYFGRL